MSFPITKISPTDFLPLLSEINDPPQTLYLRGTLPPLEYKLLAIVGSREYSPYGREVCETLIAGLRGAPLSIVSGLALGIDGIAHKAALRAGIHTIAVPGSGLDDRVLYPRAHTSLAHEILEAGGALLSEFVPEWKPRPESFPERNRIMAGMSHATLIIEATERSGTLITARLAMEYNREVLAVPGSIFGATAYGPHMLIRNGAALITKSEDILETLGLQTEMGSGAARLGWAAPQSLSRREHIVYTLLALSPLPRERLMETLIEEHTLSVSEVNVLLSGMELKGIITESLGEIRLY